MRSHRLVALQLFALATVSGCSCFQPVTEIQCDAKTPCGSGWICVDGQCVPPGSGGGSGGGAGGVGGGGVGVGGGTGVGGGSGVGGGTGVGGGGGVCTGCLSINGQCLPGNTPANCGAFGKACVGCSSAQTCVGGACVATGCSASNCTGCCAGNICIGPANETNLFCGNSGQICIACPMGQACQNTKCVPIVAQCNLSNCPGCCSGGVCVVNTSPSNCGANGTTCVTCAAGQSCNGGVCGTTCNASNCTGCCDTGKCVPFSSQSSLTCGSFGGVCKPCPPGANCQMGQCNAPVCNGSNCAGCCINGFCSPGNSVAACGVSGNTCTSCQGNQQCQMGQCIQPPKQIGDPCNFTAECGSIGPGAYCKTLTSTGNGVYQNGFCTRPCAADGGTGCTSTTLCLNQLSPYGENDAFCSPRCSNANQCRTPGYACYFFVTSSANACWLNPIPNVGVDGGMPDAGVGSTIGNACVNDGQCLQPAASFCIPDVAPGIGATGFVGGYCSTSCNGSACVSGSTCTSVNSGVGAFPVCLKNCPVPRMGQSTCRNGYVCEGITGMTGGYCLPRCSNTGANCPTGTTCNTTSGYCS